jgi:copper(I)-binding protein
MKLPMLRTYRALLKCIALSLLPLLTIAVTHSASAQVVNIQSARANPTVPGQMSSGVFMKITSNSDTRLVAVSSPVAGVAEVHEMTMTGTVMKMRAVSGGLPLTKGKTVELAPGSYHIMLMDLKQPLTKGSVIPMTLLFKADDGKESKYSLSVPVASATDMAPSGSGNP